MCEKLFKVKVDAQQLYYKEPFMGMPELLEPDDYDISYLGRERTARASWSGRWLEMFFVALTYFNIMYVNMSINTVYTYSLCTCVGLRDFLHCGQRQGV